jgi:hypothetical protein
MNDQTATPEAARVVASLFAPPYEHGKADERARIIGLLQNFEANSRAAGLARSARIATDLLALIAPAQ